MRNVRRKGMKYQTRMVIYYTSLALILSFVLGLTIFWSGLHEQYREREERLSVVSRQIAAQMEDRLRKMDVAMNYLLSDPDFLRDIALLGMYGGGGVPSSYLYEAATEVNVTLTTDYIIRSTYRTVFFNQTGYLFSSFIRNSSGAAERRTAVDFSPDSLPYLSQADAARGKSVLIGPHTDPYAFRDGVEVYSLVKALQGYQMGYLEVENTLAGLDTLQNPDSSAGFQIYLASGQMLYASRTEQNAPDFSTVFQDLPADVAQTRAGFLVVKTVLEEYPLVVLAYQPESMIYANLAVPLVTAFTASLAVFAFGLFLVIFWSFLLTKPIHSLRLAMESTTLENLGESYTGGSGAELDEIRALERSYQALTTRLNEAVQKEKKASMLQLQAQFDVLQTQVNPHFIYNVLNILSARGILDDDDSICEICASLASMLRYSTSNRERYALVRQELVYLDSYFYLLKARYEDGFIAQVDVDEAVRDCVIPKMALQQIVENSMKHGFEDRRQDMRVSVTGRMLADRWEITVRDNGCGFPEESLRRVRERFAEVREKLRSPENMIELEIGGMGLVNTYARCLLHYDGDLIFEVRNGNPGAEVVVGSFLHREEETEKQRAGL